MVILRLIATFGAETFKNGFSVLLTELLQSSRQDDLLTLIAMTYGRIGELLTLTRLSEQMLGNVKKFDMQRATASWISEANIRDLRHTLIQDLMQQNRFSTGEDKTIKSDEDVRRYVGGMPLLRDLCLAMRINL